MKPWVAILFTILLSIPASQADEKFILTSSVLSERGALPTKYAGQGGPRNCSGNNISPPLQWSNPPKGTRSFVITITDMDGFGEPNGAGFIHWIAYSIPGAASSLNEGEGNGSSAKFLAGKNTLGLTTYAGPCPRVGKDGPHQYVINITALSNDMAGLRPGLSFSELHNATSKYELNAASITVYHPGGLQGVKK